MQANPTLESADRQPSISPEIAEALKTLRAADFRLEADYFPFGDWESRLELADDLRSILDDLPTDELADMTAAVVRDLEADGEDFGEWLVRCDAAERLRRVIRSIEPKEVRVHA